MLSSWMGEGDGYALLLDGRGPLKTGLKDAHQQLALEEIVLKIVSLRGCDVLRLGTHVLWWRHRRSAPSSVCWGRHRGSRGRLMLLRRLPLLVLLVPIRRRLPVRLLARCLLLLLLHLHLQLLLLLLLRLRLLHLEPLGHCHATVCCSWLHVCRICGGSCPGCRTIPRRTTSLVGDSSW